MKTKHYGKTRNPDTLKRWVNRNPNKAKAGQTVNELVRAGKIPRVSTLTCIHQGNRCTNQAEHYHHYKGYDEEHWLDIVPVCTRCHKEIHSN